jgi:hypothetical protein
MVNAVIPSGMLNGRHAVHKRFDKQAGGFIIIKNTTNLGLSIIRKTQKRIYQEIL